MIDLRDSTDPELGVVASVIAQLGEAAGASGVRFMVVGATARNIVSIGLVGRPPERATRDVDVAVVVDSWSDFHALARRLPRLGRSEHRFVLSGVELDIVPYGGIETDRVVTWSDGTRMNVLGLREVAAGAQKAVLPGGPLVTVPTVPGLAALKLVTWSDRHRVTRRDAVDLDTIISWYGADPFLDMAYADVDVLEAQGFDPELAGAQHLGSSVASLLGPATTSALDALLTDLALAALANDMPRRVVDHRARLAALRTGLRTASARSADPA